MKILLVTLMLVHVSPKKIAYREMQHIFESTQNKQQYGTKVTSTEVRSKIVMIS